MAILTQGTQHRKGGSATGTAKKKRLNRDERKDFEIMRSAERNPELVRLLPRHVEAVAALIGRAATEATVAELLELAKTESDNWPVGGKEAATRDGPAVAPAGHLRHGAGGFPRLDPVRHQPARVPRRTPAVGYVLPPAAALPGPDQEVLTGGPRRGDFNAAAPDFIIDPDASRPSRNPGQETPRAPSWRVSPCSASSPSQPRP